MIYMNMETAKIMVISKPGFRIRNIVAGGPRSFGIEPTYKCMKIQNIKAEPYQQRFQ